MRLIKIENYNALPMIADVFGEFNWMGSLVSIRWRFAIANV